HLLRPDHQLDDLKRDHEYWVDDWTAAAAVPANDSGRADLSEYSPECFGETTNASEHRVLRARHAEPDDSPVRPDLRPEDRGQHGVLGLVRRQPGTPPAGVPRSEPDAYLEHSELCRQRRSARRTDANRTVIHGHTS